MRVEYTAAAIDDLRTIGDFIAIDSRKHAKSFVGELRAACRSLSADSLRYPLQPQWRGVRRMPLRAYLIFYRVTGETVEILRVLHSARDVGDVLL